MIQSLFVAIILICCTESIHAQAINSIQLRRGTGNITLVSATTGSYSLTFPSTAGSSNQVLTTDGSGTLSWTTPSGGGTSLDDLTDAVLKSQPFDQYSIAIGVGALTTFNVTDNINNIAIGTKALEVMGSDTYYGQGHIAIGTMAHQYDDGATGNYTIGHYAMKAALGTPNQGQDNIAFGTSSIRNGTSSGGSANISIGHQAVSGNQLSGTQNIVLGSIVGSSVDATAYSLTSGSRNIIIGSEAGNDINTGSGNIIIGYRVGSENVTGAAVQDPGDPGAPLSRVDAESNLLMIDNSNTATPLIFGNFSARTLTFNGSVTIASDKLRVSTAKTPASATADGNAGDICWDANYIYVCVATNSWKRIAIAAW